MGVGKGITSAQMIYINNFELASDKKLSDYLIFVPEMKPFGEGDERSHLFQSAYEIAPNKRLQLKTVLNLQLPDKIKRVMLECNCVANNTIDSDIPWKELAQDAHDYAKNAFINITTKYFKNLIL